VTTNEYRWIVSGQISGIALLGLISIIVVFGAMPKYSARANLREAIDRYEIGTDASAREAEQALDEALARDPDMVPALALRGRIALGKDNLDIARDAYKKLARVCSTRRLSGASALNGLGCVMLSEAQNAGKNRQERLAEAYQTFLKAISMDPGDGDGHVNAAICKLHMGDPLEAARHLAAGRRTKSVSYDSLVMYHAAVGSMLAAASAEGGRAAALVAREFNDSDPELRKTGRMLFRAVAEFEMASELALPGRSWDELQVRKALVEAKLLAWAPLGREQSAEYRNDILGVLAKQEHLLSAEQKRLLYVVIAVSSRRGAYIQQAAKATEKDGRTGRLSPETSFYMGVALCHLAESERQGSLQAQMRANAADYLLAALAGPGLAARQRLRALSDLAVIRWYAKDFPGALKHAAEAAEILAGLEKSGDAPDGFERGGFHRNAGVIRYENGERDASVTAFDKSIGADPQQTDVGLFLAKMRREPIIDDIRTMTVEQLPPSMPVVTAKVVSGGAVAVRKEDISVEIDGESVAFITAGPGGRIYALPRNGLAEGTHTIKVAVSAAGKSPVVETKTFDLAYGVEIMNPEAKGD